MPDLHITAHAVQRYQERVAAVTDAQARTALASENVLQAAAFGACYVRLGTGHRIVLDGWVVVTVLPAMHMGKACGRVRPSAKGENGL